MNINYKSLTSVAEAYVQMMKTSSAQVERPHWVPKTISEGRVSDFVKVIIEARVNKKNTVDFDGKKYAIKEESPADQAKELEKVAKDLPVKGDNSKEIQHNVDHDESSKEDMPKAPEQVSEDAASTQTANVSDKRSSEDKKEEVTDSTKSKVTADTSGSTTTVDKIDDVADESAPKVVAQLDEDSEQKQKDNLADKNSQEDKMSSVTNTAQPDGKESGFEADTQASNVTDKSGSADKQNTLTDPTPGTASVVSGDSETKQKANNSEKGVGVQKEETQSSQQWIAEYLQKNAGSKQFRGKSLEEKKTMARNAYQRMFFEKADYYDGERVMSSLANTYRNMMNETAAKGGPEVMDAATKKMKDDHDKKIKVEEVKLSVAQDGTDGLKKADLPKPEGSSKGLPVKVSLEPEKDAQTGAEHVKKAPENKAGQ